MPTAKETNTITKQQATALHFISKAHHIQEKEEDENEKEAGRADSLGVDVLKEGLDDILVGENEKEESIVL